MAINAANSNWGQFDFWKERIIDYNPIDIDELEPEVVDLFSQYEDWTSITLPLAEFYTKYGVICSTEDVKKVLKRFERDGRIKCF